MRILSQYQTAYEADDVACMLEDRGIAAFVSGRYEEWAGSFFRGPAAAALWVVLDEQYDDATRLLADPDHEVEIALSISEIQSLKLSIDRSHDAKWLPVWVKVAIFLVLILMVGIWIKHPHVTGTAWP